MPPTAPSPDHQETADTQQAQTELQQFLTGVQSQALYDALLQARILIAQQVRENAELRHQLADHEPDGENP